MSNDYKAGKIAAYEEMKSYATSMIGANPIREDLDPWLDMSLYANTSLDELEHDIEIPELDLVEFAQKTGI